MSLSRDKAILAIYDAIDELNQQIEGADLPRSEETILFGEGAALDSLNLVNLVMMVEQNIMMETGEEILLASEAAMSRKRSPYRTVKSLADYAAEVASEST
ncbi:MAG: hypothetical protein AAFQ15_13585 [Pseudomonadota bacterium]